MLSENNEAQQCANTNRASIEKSCTGNIDMKSLAKAAPEFTIFKFGAHDVRVVKKDGDPWFVAEDVCKALKLSNPSMSLKSLDDDERSKFNLGRQGEANIISESGMFTLVLRCRDAVNFGSIPHQFRKWVTSEVLTSIRKTGKYSKKDEKDGGLISSLELICETWDAARQQINTFDPKMAARLNSTMNMFWMYTMNIKGKSKGGVKHRTNFLQ